MCRFVKSDFEILIRFWVRAHTCSQTDGHEIQNQEAVLTYYLSKLNKLLLEFSWEKMVKISKIENKRARRCKSYTPPTFSYTCFLQVNKCFSVLQKKDFIQYLTTLAWVYLNFEQVMKEAFSQWDYHITWTIVGTDHYKIVYFSLASAQNCLKWHKVAFTEILVCHYWSPSNSLKYCSPSLQR